MTKPDTEFQKALMAEALPPNLALIALAIAIGIGVFAFDLLMPLGVAAGVGQAAMVLVGIWLPRPRQVFALAGFASVLIIIGYGFSAEGGVQWVVLVNRGLSLLVVCLTAVLIASRKQVENDRNEKASQLDFQKQALDEHAIVSITNIRGDITYANDKFCEISGYSRDELLGQNHRILKSGEHPDEFYDEMWRTICDGKTWQGEIMNSRKDGRPYWVNATIVPTLNSLGKIFQYVAIRTDITRQKNFEAELRDREHSLRVITDNLPVLISYVDKDFRYQFANETATTWYGMKPVEFIGRTIPEIFGEAAFESFRSYIEAVLGGEEVQFEADFTFPDGMARLVQVTYIPHFVSTGDVVGYFVLADDVSKKFETERELRASQRMISNVLSGTHEGYCQIDNDTMILAVNKSMCRILGREEDEIVGKSIFNFVDEENATIFRAQIFNRSSGLNNSYEITFQRPDGTNVACINSAITIYDDLGKKVGSVGLITEITELKTALVEADRANQAKTEFLSSISHELRTPLNAVLGFSHLLKDDQDDPLNSDQIDSIDQVIFAGNHLLKLVNEVLDLSKIESGDLKLSISDVELLPLLEECVDLMSAQAEKSNIEIKLVRPTDLADLVLAADHMRLNQCLLNLISNAVKYNNYGGSIEIAAGPTAHGQIYIEVRDNGVGIEQHRLHELFEPFNRLGHESGVIEGTGIGLVITRRLVKAMKGNIKVESEFGEGSAFTMFIPAA